MPDMPLPGVLIVAASSQRGRSDKLASLLATDKFRVSHWPDDADDEGESSRSLADATAQATIVVLLADAGFASGRMGDRSDINEALAKASDRLLIVIVDPAGRVALSLRSIDVVPTRGSLADLDEKAHSRAIERVATEIASEVDGSYERQPAKNFDEYRLLFESTDRLVQRRRETTQVFFGVNAALSAVITFFIKDLALQGPRLAVVTIPLFVMGMLACRLWQRMIGQYETLIDWRYRQIRRIERRGFAGSYRMFSREWDAIYAPRRLGEYGFSGIERTVPMLFFGLHVLGACFAVAVWLGVFERMGY